LIKEPQLKPTVVRVGEFDRVTPGMREFSLEERVRISKPHIKSTQIDQWKKRAKQILGKASVVCSTAAGAALSELKSMKFDYVVIDEAAQLTEPDSLVAIVKAAKKVILVGDHKQLGAVVTPPGCEMKLEVSLFERLANCANTRVWLLDTQYRMHPKLAEFPSRYFYENKLMNGVNEEDRPLPLGFQWPNPKSGPVAFINVEGREEMGREEGGRSRRNPLEAQRVLKIIQGLRNSPKQNGSVGLDVERDVVVITPYVAQLNLIKKLLGESGLGSIEVGSVDGFQGREKEVVVFSCCRSGKSVGFLKDQKRMNVAITRPRSGLIVVGRRETLVRDSTWRAWLDWVDQNNFSISQ